MTLNLSLACWNHDRCNPVLNGDVTVPGVSFDCHVAPPGKLFPLAVSTAPYDITEMSASSYLMQVEQGSSAYRAIPVYVSRAFRHDGFYVRSDSGIETPAQLQGKRVGVPEYQMTMALWARGMLADEFGVDTDTFRYFTGGTNRAGRKERLSLKLPDHMSVTPIDEKRTLNDLLISGELDALISPEPPLCFQRGGPEIRRLFADPRKAEQDYYLSSGMFPIMHVIGIKKGLLDRRDGLATGIYNAFLEARRKTMAEIKQTATASSNRVHLPWFAREWENTVELMGEEFWPYGVADNAAELTAMCRYSNEQHLTARRLDVEELFAEETLDLAGV